MSTHVGETVLIVENQRGFYSQLSDTLKGRGLGCEIAETLLETKGLLRDLTVVAALVDLNLRKSNVSRDEHEADEPAGTAVCRLIRADFPQAFILLYSTAFENIGPAELERIKDNAQADDIRAVSWLTPQLYSDSLAAYVNAGIKVKREAYLHGRTMTWTQDLRTLAVIETMSVPTVQGLLRELLPDETHFELTALAGGLSGSQVIRVSTIPEASGRPPRELVLKADLRQHRILDELAAAPLLGSSEYLIAAGGADAVNAPVNGWWGMLSPFVKGRSLRSLLMDASDLPARQAAAERVARLIIKPPIERSGFRLGGEDDWTQLTAQFASDVATAVSYIASTAGAFGIDVEDDAPVTHAFLERGVRMGWSANQNTTRFSYSHGDLHSENVLIGEDGHLHVIDFSCSVRLPRLFDTTSLALDLILRCAAEGPAAWDGSLASRHLHILAGIAPLSPQVWEGMIDGFGPPAAVLTEVSKVWQAADPSVDTAELRDVFLFHALRWVRFANLALPRRTLALRFAAALIRQAGHVRATGPHPKGVG